MDRNTSLNKLIYLPLCSYLKYGFVTPVTPLVVVQPNITKVAVESPEENLLGVKMGIRTGSGDQMPAKSSGGVRCRGMPPKQGIQAGSNKINGTIPGNSTIDVNSFGALVLNGTLL